MTYMATRRPGELKVKKAQGTVTKYPVRLIQSDRLAHSLIQNEVEGHVYILSNASMPSLLKVGFTTGKVTKRASELSDMTSVPTAFKVEWSHPVTGNACAKLVPF